jgi:hypothetical protein
VLVDISGLRKEPQEWVSSPSLVGLERANSRYDIWGQILTFSTDAFFKVVAGSSDGEVSAGSGTGDSRRPGGSGAGVVERIPEILKGVRCDIGEISEIDAMKHYLELFQSGVLRRAPELTRLCFPKMTQAVCS